MLLQPGDQMNQLRKILRNPVIDHSLQDLFTRFAKGFVKRVNGDTFALDIDLNMLEVDFNLFDHRAKLDLSGGKIALSICALDNVPEKLRRYMVIHELAHFVAGADHGEAFWAEVARFEPNYVNLERQLSICFERNVSEHLLRRGEVTVIDKLRGRSIRPRILVGRPGSVVGIDDELLLARHCRNLVKDAELGLSTEAQSDFVEIQGDGFGSCLITASNKAKADKAATVATSDIEVNTINGIAAPVPAL